MILLKKVRLINWYGFSDQTFPIGRFTLIAGKNGNGKTVVLDAIKYAAYGDTVFNKSSDNLGSRTIVSYTRGFLDPTHTTQIRPAGKIPTVYSHIAMEYYDEIEDKSFVLGTVIETNSTDNTQTYRYVMDRKTLDEIELTYDDNGKTMPCSSAMISERYHVPRLNREDGLNRFMQMTGLRLRVDKSEGSTAGRKMDMVQRYLRKLRAILSYSPDPRIDRFIRERVLEKNDVDLSILITEQEKIDKLTKALEEIGKEQDELDAVLKLFATAKGARDRRVRAEIRTVYDAMQTLSEKISELKDKKETADLENIRLQQEIKTLEQKKNDLRAQLADTDENLRKNDTYAAVREIEATLKSLNAAKEEKEKRAAALTRFQEQVQNIVERFEKEGQVVEQRPILMSLTKETYSASEKTQAVSKLLETINTAYVKQIEGRTLAQKNLDDLLKKRMEQERIIEACRRHQSAFSRIPDYVGLRNDINNALAAAGREERAFFASEYVVSLKDESWRNAVEAFLGPRRYTILVPPACYEIAEEAMKKSRYRYAHLFNTPLLMKKEITVKEDSAVHLLEIQNPVTQRYFDFQLGRMHMATPEMAHKYENSLTKDGRVSKRMDTYYLRFNKIDFYYLGQQTFELNQRRAEAEIERLAKESVKCKEACDTYSRRQLELDAQKELFRNYDYDSPQACRKLEMEISQKEKQREDLHRDLEESGFGALLLLKQQLEAEIKNEEKREDALRKHQFEQGKISAACGKEMEEKQNRLEKQQTRYHTYEEEEGSVLQDALKEYQAYVARGRTGRGGPATEERRKELEKEEQTAEENVRGKQHEYNLTYASRSVPLRIGLEYEAEYADRSEEIRMKDREECLKKLNAQKTQFEEDFKKEFVVKIFNHCEEAKRELRAINRELAKLDFVAKYQFQIKQVKDHPEYETILKYAKYLDERKDLGEQSGQMTFDSFAEVSDEEGDLLEKELKKIVDAITEKNDPEVIQRYADYRNYMAYEILITNDVLHNAELSKQTGFNSGAEVQIPHLLILTTALLIIYNQYVNSARLVYIDEPFAKMDPGNVRIMLKFMRDQNLQMIFCSPDKTETIGNACDVILPVLKVNETLMQLGVVKFKEVKNDVA